MMSAFVPSLPGINMFYQDNNVFKSDGDGTRISDLSGNSVIFISTNGVEIGGYTLPPGLGQNGQVMTAQNTTQVEWQTPAVKSSFAVTFGGIIEENAYFVVNGISTTPTNTSLSTGATFVCPTSCTLISISYISNCPNPIPVSAKVLVQTQTPNFDEREVLIQDSYGAQLLSPGLLVGSGGRVFLRFSCPSGAMDTYEATFTCLFQQM